MNLLYINKKREKVMSKLNSILVIILAFFATTAINAQEPEYIGAMKCKMCHNKPTTGKQYTIWSEGPHAKAMETLKSDKAKEIAKKKGIDDPSKAEACVKCHATTGHTDKNLHLTITQDEGVSCESCHGAGSKYKSMAVMKSREKSIENGLIIPDEKLCKQCHNEESPTFKGFNFDEYAKKIAHPNPAK